MRAGRPAVRACFPAPLPRAAPPCIGGMLDGARARHLLARVSLLRAERLLLGLLRPTNATAAPTRCRDPWRRATWSTVRATSPAHETRDVGRTMATGFIGRSSKRAPMARTSRKSATGYGRAGGLPQKQWLLAISAVDPVAQHAALAIPWGLKRLHHEVVW